LVRKIIPVNDLKILLDSTYFLPIFNVNVSVPVDCLEQIARRPHKFFYSDLVYFECNAKASKYGCENHNEITEELINDILWTELTSNKYPIWEVACFFKKYHQDFVDCLHYATAIVTKMDLFLTQEQKFKKSIKKIEKEFAEQFPSYKLVKMISYSEYILSHVLDE